MSREYPEILTLQQAAELLQISERTIQRMLKKGKFPEPRSAASGVSTANSCAPWSGASGNPSPTRSDGRDHDNGRGHSSGFPGLQQAARSVCGTGKMIWNQKTTAKMRRFAALYPTLAPPGPVGAGLTTSDLGAPDFALACEQFDLYVAALQEFGLDVTVLEALEGYPDAHFVEDTAVVTPDMAVITNPGAPARQGEQPSVAEALGGPAQLDHIQAPGTLDGGDVLMIGNHFLIGVSDRTNAEGARQLGVILDSFGYTWQTVPVGAGLHFKSSVNLVGENMLLVTEAFADREELSRYQLVQVPAGEEYAANTLFINGRLIMPAGYPATRSRLEALDLPISGTGYQRIPQNGRWFDLFIAEILKVAEILV